MAWSMQRERAWGHPSLPVSEGLRISGLGSLRDGGVGSVLILGVVLLVGRPEQAKAGEDDERGREDGAPRNGSVVHAFVSRPIGCGPSS